MDTVKIVEVGPRDGLQNEKKIWTTADKLWLIDGLVNTGLKHIEATAFVSPKWVPAMADHQDIMEALNKHPKKPSVVYSVLTPNIKGLEAALSIGVDEVAVFSAASEAFCKKNINATIQESIERFVSVIERAKAEQIPVRGYVSCVESCPYEGMITPEAVAKVAGELYRLGCYEISLGDTIGTGTPKRIKAMLKAVSNEVPMHALAGHFHNTYGMAIANIMASLEMGVRVFDASIAGLGGCPYAEGASGNVATEEVVYLLEKEGFNTGVDLDSINAISKLVSNKGKA